MKANPQPQGRNRLCRAIAGVILGFWISGCDTTSTNGTSVGADDKPNVVATSTIIADWTEQVGGDEIELTGILEPGADPHVYEPVPADSQALEEADLIFYNGYNLEPGLIKLMQSAGVNAKKLAVGEVVQPLDFEYQGKKEPDPHVWGDAKNAIAMVNAIRDELIELSPEDKEKFTQNAAQLTQELQQLDTWIAEQIQTIPGNQRQLVTTHDAFQYYARAYGLNVAGTLIGISTEEQPSARTVKTLSDSIQKIGVPTIFAETTINPALIKTVAEEAGVTLAPTELYSDSIGASGSEGDTYVKMLIVNTRTIVEALGGNSRAFESDGEGEAVGNDADRMEKVNNSR
ncbi:MULTISPECIES: metal ABC transporter substrate-binding protein [unclassified Coleofasciculus]|uniref:metal ABC transporter substrate-binding protein n=1 Tax=unclassified Coleofasciculus TaxID=2692782 RepID=UPI00187EAB16|nr:MULTISPECIES: metal ABC transporter substrate-binding protein [unclassified Coleofasciculus]MBE9125515.1 metal ABC transporter substrate-binding protein [Coleofasciculus sp. LEGE 07081]MBE9148621.1 metal ABC transporter substrate-binding protein [Coleofasciculus sp. LEGE 07092]